MQVLEIKEVLYKLCQIKEENGIFSFFIYFLYEREKVTFRITDAKTIILYRGV